ncbi:MFS transporter [Saccharopolyspora sp. WRP15-2]|uniref:MFS transporter n=1 Tax=Saccharopolyspora oryzae TaxID=2997343 RepID=A0ABT4US79_9PSEU|nr:MFS transporter [Saccharopolyspora oryzae]MDA3623927.1 MFS transporter [Saccharopolyspora oryzae]
MARAEQHSTIPHAPDRPAPDATPNRWRVIVGAGVGNALEWYDWTVYAIFAPFFASQFFHEDNPASALLSTLAVFAVGFLMRPLGGLFFGWLADRRGRRSAMVTAMIITAVGSLLIGVSPTYPAVGVLASVLLVLARLGQGFGLGGEIGGSHVYLAEMAPRRRRGLWCSSMYIAITCGVLAATLLAAVLTTALGKQAMTAWGWRLPFLLGAVLGFYAIFLRRGLQETDAYVKDKQDTARTSVLRGVWSNRRAAWKVVGLTIGGTVAYYTWSVSATSYAINAKGIDAQQALWAGVAANLVFIAALPLWGALSDRWGRKPNLFLFPIALGALTFPLTGLIQDSAWQLAVSMSVALFVLGSVTSIAPAFNAELFPTRVRATGFAFPYSLAVAVFGGTAPYLQTFLASHGLGYLFTLYSIALLAISFLTAFTVKETKGIELE